jgi:hypothetical protein
MLPVSSPAQAGRIASLVATGVECAENRLGAGGGQEMAPFLIDNFGAYSRTHRESPRIA